VRKEPKWISRQAVLALHERLLAEHGGAPGLLDEGLLEAALASPRNHLAYEQVDIFRLAAAYAHALTRDHPFSDGNKRIALTVAGVFPELNGYRLEAPEVEAVAATTALSTRQLDERGFAEWLRASSSKLSSRAKRAATRTRRPPKKK
jgi:death-on-curing protein